MTNFLDNHKQKCRCCFQNFTEQNQKVKITQKICRNFLAVVQIELQMSSSYSNFLCKLCYNQLEKFVQFKTDAFDKQTQLYVSQRKTQGKRLQCDESDDEPFSDETVLIKMEPNASFSLNEEFQLTECSVVIESCPQIEFLTETKTEVFENYEIYDSSSYADNLEIISNRSGSSDEDLTFKEWKNLPKPSKYVKKMKKPKISCQKCPKTFRSEIVYENHFNKIHIGVKNFACHFKSCKNSFYTDKLLQKHIRRAHENQVERQQCPDCGTFVVQLKEHIKVVHLKVEKFFCDICGKSCALKKRLRSHMFSHLSKATKKDLVGVTCEICGVSVLRQVALDKHMISRHSDAEAKFICHCGKAFKVEYMLKAHQRRVHKERKKIPCNLCKKTFINTRDLKSHLDHNQDHKRELPCEICGKLYPTLRALKNHIIFHEEPTHVCDICGKKFHQNFILLRHQKTQHEANFTDCQYCGKSISCYQMNRHVKEFHSGLKKQKCPIEDCKRTFLRKCRMQDHFKRVHRHFFNSLNAEQRTNFDQNFVHISKLLI